MKNHFIVIATLLLLFVSVNAQEKWTLSHCIDHALIHNIDIKQQELNTQYQSNTLEQSKHNRLPNLNAGVSQNFGFGRSLNIKNSYVNSTSSNTGFSINSSMVLWNAGQLQNSIKQQEFEFKSSLENLEKAKDDITINLAQAYLEILFSEELVKVAETQLEQTEIQIQRTVQLVAAGKVAEGTLLEVKAQAARESLNLVNAKNDYTIASLKLAQILELEDYTGFSIEQPLLPAMQAELSILTARAVYETAVEYRPEIRSAQYKLESSHSQLQIAKASRIPSLTASAGFYDQYLTTSNSSDIGFAQQIKDNHRSNIGVNLSIPIFNRYENRSKIQNAEIQIESRRLDLEATKKELRRQIEQAYVNAYASYERYNANEVAVESMEESFRYMEQKFNLGRVNSVEYNESKTKLTKAQSDLVQAKYEFIFRSKILDFYNGTAIML